MDNISFYFIKEELERLKNMALKDGEVKYFEHTIKKKVGFFRKKEVTEVVGREIVEVGDYITLKEYIKIIKDFLEKIGYEVKRISDNIKKELKDEIMITFGKDRIKVENRSKRLFVYMIDNKLFDDDISYKDLFLNDVLRNALLELVDCYRYYKEFRSCSKNKIVLSDDISIEIKHYFKGALSDIYLDLNLGNYADYIVFFNLDSRKLERYIDSNDIKLKLYLLEKSHNLELESEIFINKNSIKDMLDLFKNYDKFLVEKELINE